MGMRRNLNRLCRGKRSRTGKKTSFSSRSSIDKKRWGPRVGQELLRNFGAQLLLGSVVYLLIGGWKDAS